MAAGERQSDRWSEDPEGDLLRDRLTSASGDSTEIPTEAHV
jgi:hypothetical protein